MSASPGFLSALQQGLSIDQYYQNIRNFTSQGLSPEELVAAAAEYGISGEDIMRATGVSPMSTYSPDSGPSDGPLAVALDSIPMTIDTGVQYAPATDSGDSSQAEGFAVINPRTGEMEGAQRASEFIPGAPANQFIVSSGQGVFEQDGKRYQPVNLVTVGADGSVTPSGTFNLEKNELPEWAQTLGNITKGVAIAGSLYGIGAGLGLFGGAGGAAAGSAAAADAAFVAADAAQLAAQGLGQGQIASTLVASGVGGQAAATAATLAAAGANAGTIASALGPGNLFTATAGDLAASGITTGGTGGVPAASPAGTGLNINAAGQTGLTVPTTPATTVADAGLLSGTTTPTIGGGALGTGLTTSVAGPGLTSVAGLEGVLGAGESLIGAGTGINLTNLTGAAPGLTSMGGGTGLLTPAAGGGTLGATGVTPAGATPVIGSPGSIINNPSVLGTPVTGVTPGGVTIPGTVASTPAGTGLLSQLLGGGSLTDLLTNLAGTGIDYAKLQALADEASRTGKSLSELASQAGARANVPFTPYTVTTGSGTTSFGTDAQGRPTATALAAPEYEALRQQALQQAGTTLGAINPANSAQSLYDRARALSAPTEQRQQEQLLSTLGARGLLGIGRNMPTVGGTTAAVNPYVESLLSAQRTADANLALQSQQYGTQEAMRQQQLAQGLQSQAQAVDVAAQNLFAPSLQFGQSATSANQVNAANQLRADLTGLALRVPFEEQGYLARQQGITGAANMTRGLFGLPTTPGNTGSTNIVGNLLNYGFRELFG